MEIYKKLLKFQKLKINVKKDGKNPHFKSSYATLNEVLEKVKEPLNELGVLIVFEPQSEGLLTKLVDVESGTFISSFMKYVSINNAQSLLSCNTYFRRGSLVALLGLEDEDDDGNFVLKPQPKAPTITLEYAENNLKDALTIDELRSRYKSFPDDLQKKTLNLSKELALKFTTNK